MPSEGDALPLIDIAVEPKSKADQERLRVALAQLAAEDPKLRVRTDEESGQTIVSGMDDPHLDGIVDRLRQRVDVNIGAPQVAYRETITRTVEQDYTHKKQMGGLGEFARIRFRIEPMAHPDTRFVATVIDGHVPTPYIPAVKRGVMAVAEAGPLIGFPIIGVNFVLTDGAYHDIDSSAAAFEIAGRVGFREALERAGPKILEPIMRVEVRCPAPYLADVIGDLNARRARVVTADEHGDPFSVSAEVPLASMFGYDSSLHAISRGVAHHTMSFVRYEPTPDPWEPDGGLFPPAAAMRA